MGPAGISFLTDDVCPGRPLQSRGAQTRVTPIVYSRKSTSWYPLKEFLPGAYTPKVFLPHEQPIPAPETKRSH
eukprot:8315505-Pyramimonas_sp.AAC.1